MTTGGQKGQKQACMAWHGDLYIRHYSVHQIVTSWSWLTTGTRESTVVYVEKKQTNKIHMFFQGYFLFLGKCGGLPEHTSLLKFPVFSWTFT
jgi:hypothetical protein